MTPKVIVISGTMGAGKTTVLGEASDILAARNVAHAAVDLDGLAVVGLPADVMRRLSSLNLAAVFEHFIASGIRHLLVAVAVESSEELRELRRAMSGAEMVVCRLVAGSTTLEQRLRTREPGMCQEQFVARSQQLATTLERAALEDFTETNDGRSIAEVAAAVLRRAGWID